MTKRLLLTIEAIRIHWSGCLDTKDEQIRELKNDFVKKDQEWMEKVEELRGQLGKRDDEVYKNSVILV